MKADWVLQQQLDVFLFYICPLYIFPVYIKVKMLLRLIICVFKKKSFSNSGCWIFYVYNFLGMEIGENTHITLNEELCKSCAFGGQ